MAEFRPAMNSVMVFFDAAMEPEQDTLGTGPTTRQRSTASNGGAGSVALKAGGSSQGYAAFREFFAGQK